MKKIIFMSLALTSLIVVHAQEESGTFKVKAVNLQIGLYNANSAVSNLSDFQKLAPNSVFKEADIVGFRTQNSFYGSSGPAFSMNLVIAKSEGSKLSYLNPEFRLGVSYQQADLLYLGYTKRNESRVDTLTSSKTGEQTFTDSINTQDYSLTYSQTHVMVDADVTISTNHARRLKFYGGIGFSLGLSISPNTTISYTESIRFEQEGLDDNDITYGYDSEGTQESFNNDGGFLGRVYLPLGVDFRIGKRKEVLKQYHIFAESRPSLSFQSVPELNMMTTTSNYSSIGMRYNF